ncbi:baseplate hub protein [Paraburkholderia tagetis]|uniref:Uncharacterized protein n=1 Tax=Paraburkholderia tagetis TaxID=2913261 RepID=A0A9X1RI74_9BURK|nr:hypothetical protein [Paraburkholderia tagetis]MCG5073036.1 hypothetical protein [Paraburkholderia tagetis]
MAFAERILNVRYDLAQSAFPDGSHTLSLQGHRVQAQIATLSAGSLASYVLALRVYGMRMSDMDALSQWNTLGALIGENEITLSASSPGTSFNALRTVFSGTIYAAVVEIEDNGESALVVFAQGGLYERLAPNAPNTYPGAQDVASIISGLAKQAGFTFQNHGVTAKIANQYLWGSVLDQIERVAEAAQVVMLIDNARTVHIWPNSLVPDFAQIDLSANNGLIGYPKFVEQGIQVRAEFRPDFLYGQVVNLKSVIPRASGSWQVGAITHELSTMTPGGPWFSTMTLVSQGLNLARKN